MARPDATRETTFGSHVQPGRRADGGSLRGLRHRAVDLGVDPHVVERAGDDGDSGVAERLAADVAVVAQVTTLPGGEDPDHEPNDHDDADQVAHGALPRRTSGCRRWRPPSDARSVQGMAGPPEG